MENFNTMEEFPVLFSTKPHQQDTKNKEKTIINRLSPTPNYAKKLKNNLQETNTQEKEIYNIDDLFDINPDIILKKKLTTMNSIDKTYQEIEKINSNILEANVKADKLIKSFNNEKQNYLNSDDDSYDKSKLLKIIEEINELKQTASLYKKEKIQIEHKQKLLTNEFNYQQFKNIIESTEYGLRLNPVLTDDFELFCELPKKIWDTVIKKVYTSFKIYKNKNKNEEYHITLGQKQNNNILSINLISLCKKCSPSQSCPSPSNIAEKQNGFVIKNVVKNKVNNELITYINLIIHIE
jgi:hypothetical protein